MSAKTVTHFRRFREGDLIALFPYEAATRDARMCVSYQFMGEHGPADYEGILKITRPVKSRHPDAIELAKRLRSRGYVLDIRDRAPSSYEAYRQRAKGM